MHIQLRSSFLPMPRPAAPGTGWMPDPHACGMPQERLAQVAARRAFVALKDSFTAAVREAPGDNGAWLRAEVRAAEEPFDLWLLRLEVLAALPRRDPRSREFREAIERTLTSMFAASRSPHGDVSTLPG